MSWDIFVQDLPANARRISDIPEDFVPKPVGSRAKIIAKIRDIVPSADFSDLSWGHIRGNSFSIEINLGAKDEVRSFAFHVRGSDEAAGIVCDILLHLGLRALDASTGEFLDRADAPERLRRWRVYRDQIVESGDHSENNTGQQTAS